MNSFRWGVRTVACAVVLALGARALANAQGDTHPAAQSVPADDPAARALFIANCATCHGESGDGRGATKLEKPARSFKDGGFSYGNTPEALLRTITNGIPGTPMPSFASALKEDQRKALAHYVLSLGPPETKVSEAETILVVKDRPLFVRGKLPSITPEVGGTSGAPGATGSTGSTGTTGTPAVSATPAAPERPRGLLVGTTDGFTFEYRVDDVRLLGVRQGGFVERTDWQGRGGDARKPLGKLVYLFGDGNPGPTVALQAGDKSGAKALDAHLAATFVRDGRACIAYVLWADTQPLRTRVAWVEESPRAQTSAIGSGFARTFDVEDLGSGGRYSISASSTKGTTVIASGQVAAPSEAEVKASAAQAAQAKLEKERKAAAEGDYVPKVPAKKPAHVAEPPTRTRSDWVVRSRPDGMFEIVLVRGLKDSDSFVPAGDDLRVELGVEPGQSRTIEIATLLAPVWDADVRAKWTKELE